MVKVWPAFVAVACAGGLVAACGQGGGGDAASSAGSETLENGMTVAAQIELRQDQLKKYGKAFKTISDTLKTSEPDVAAIQAAAASLVAESETMADWFPAGTGPESGVETEALPAIWEDRTDFESKITDFQAAAAELDATAQTGELQAIAAQFRTTGGTCKACHDSYREDD